MKYMTWVRADKDYGQPPAGLMEAMATAGQEAFANGLMVDTGGLSTLDEGGAKVALRDGKVSVLDGPYTEAKELAGGYAILNVNTLEEAIEQAQWLLDLHKEYWPGWQGDVEVRAMWSAADMGAPQ
ncbi:YciI family protein [Aldersonia kunmingensis]|uniref:YciI family protein n=1 Tax=Aldersonia kunmingensis TaxID=408066 RepID=UPI000832F3EE|nr:YciI family protein [Aldersonia kunmingensis]